MSIIYDALKKVEKPGTKNTNKTRTVLLLIFAIVLGLFALNMLTSLQKRPKARPITAPVLPAEIPKDTLTAPLPAEKPAPPIERVRTKEPDLILSGVYFQGKLGYALINNRILKTDDTILGAKVESITLEKVILEFEGRKITLINAAR